MPDPFDSIQVPTELPARDNSRLLETVAEIRRQMTDPTSPIYANRPDLVASTEQNLKAMLIRAGVTEQVLTPEALARQQHDAQFPTREMPPGPAGIIAERVADLAKLGEWAIKEKQAELRAEMGAAEYDRLLEDATEAGQPVPEAVKADIHSLRLLAAQGRYLRGYAATKPRY